MSGLLYVVLLSVILKKWNEMIIYLQHSVITTCIIQNNYIQEIPTYIQLEIPCMEAINIKMVLK